MKTYPKLAFISIIFCMVSCEDIVDVDLQTAPTRLTIEASLDWEKGTPGNEQFIKLSTATSFFDTTTNTAVTGAMVTVTNTSDGTIFAFADQSNGLYITDDFIPIINQSYALEIRYNGETYRATETLTPVVDIDELTQSTEDGFDDEALEVNVHFIDPENEQNFYLFRFQERGDLFPELEEFDDEFINGNEISWFYEKEEDEDTNTEEFMAGDVVDIAMLGISEAYYNYISILIEQAEGDGGPFSTTPVALRGNCVNIDNADNYAHGYFRVTQVVKTSYTFQ